MLSATPDKSKRAGNFRRAVLAARLGCLLQPSVIVSDLDGILNQQNGVLVRALQLQQKSRRAETMARTGAQRTQAALGHCATGRLLAHSKGSCAGNGEFLRRGSSGGYNWCRRQCDQDSECKFFWVSKYDDEADSRCTLYKACTVMEDSADYQKCQNVAADEAKLQQIAQQDRGISPCDAIYECIEPCVANSNGWLPSCGGSDVDCGTFMDMSDLGESNQCMVDVTQSGLTVPPAATATGWSQHSREGCEAACVELGDECAGIVQYGADLCGVLRTNDANNAITSGNDLQLVPSATSPYEWKGISRYCGTCSAAEDTCAEKSSVWLPECGAGGVEDCGTFKTLLADGEDQNCWVKISPAFADLVLLSPQYAPDKAHDECKALCTGAPNCVGFAEYEPRENNPAGKRSCALYSSAAGEADDFANGNSLTLSKKVGHAGDWKGISRYCGACPTSTAAPPATPEPSDGTTGTNTTGNNTTDTSSTTVDVSTVTPECPSAPTEVATGTVTYEKIVEAKSPSEHMAASPDGQVNLDSCATVCGAKRPECAVFSYSAEDEKCKLHTQAQYDSAPTAAGNETLSVLFCKEAKFTPAAKVVDGGGGGGEQPGPGAGGEQNLGAAPEFQCC
ncbi:unnamed protein product [Amoebophrya sp. A120]|nr:unnamed protein product [Amoebophrya sp. A120]|eukprot:GSA120T00016112001.1